MRDQWSLVDRPRPKRSNEHCTELFAKRQRIVHNSLERAGEHKDGPQIRGGLARPAPPPLGPPPNRATSYASQASTTNPPGNTTASSKASQDDGFIVRTHVRIVESDEDEEEDRPWLNQPTSTAAVQPTNTHQPGFLGPSAPTQTSEVGNATAPLPPGHGSTHVLTPPQTDSSNNKPSGDPSAGTNLGTSSVTMSATTATTATGTAQPYSTEEEILRLFDMLQRMIFLWVEECLPDTFPEEFQTNQPERYWELCGWTKPMTLGNSLLQNRSWAKYVYESWVWRFLHQEIFQLKSLAWAGGDFAKKYGGLNGLGKLTNKELEFILERGQIKINQEEYEARTRNRAVLMQRVRDGLVTQDRKDRTTGRLVEEMLVAFHPYFADEYKPVTMPQNIEVLIRDTRFLILKAQELDDRLRSARQVYDMLLGKDGDVCRISGVPSPKMEHYGASSDVRILSDDDFIALIVVPGLVKSVILQKEPLAPLVGKTMIRHARAFTQFDLLAALRST